MYVRHKSNSAKWARPQTIRHVRLSRGSIWKNLTATLADKFPVKVTHEQVRNHFKQILKLIVFLNDAPDHKMPAYLWLAFDTSNESTWVATIVETWTRENITDQLARARSRGKLTPGKRLESVFHCRSVRHIYTISVRQLNKIPKSCLLLYIFKSHCQVGDSITKIRMQPW